MTQRETIERLSWSPEPAQPEESVADHAVRLGCLTFGEDHPEHWSEAEALVRDRPHLLEESIALAAACASPVAVKRHLDRDPSVARQRTGPHGWSPLLYLAYSRIESGGDAARTAELLLDAGADPNDGRYFLSQPTPFTVLTGVIGGGERSQPPHPQWRSLARLLLSRGAEANDVQALYNRMFTTDDDFLRLLLEFGLGLGDGGPWRHRLPKLTPSPAQSLRALLGWAITHDQRARVALLTAHGIDLVEPVKLVGPIAVDATPLRLALLSGYRELARQLRAAGAPEPTSDPVAELVDAALAGDAAAVRAAPSELLAATRAVRPGLVVWAAALGRVAAVELLVSCGWDVNALARSDVPIEQPWETALHTAVERDNPELVRRLLALGADPQRHDRRFDATPAGWAAHLGRTDLLPLLESA